MTKITFALFFLLFFGAVFSQNVDRNPQKTVKSKNKATLKKSKDDKSAELDIVEDYRRISIHSDGSKTIVVKFTEVAPNYFIKSDQEQQRVPLTAMSWNKADLALYISSLEDKRALVSSRPEQHSIALQNGWYDFIDSVVLEARELMSKL